MSADRKRKRRRSVAVARVAVPIVAKAVVVVVGGQLATDDVPRRLVQSGRYTWYVLTVAP